MEQLRDWLYELVVFIARVHDRLWVYNKMLPSPFSDKEMHFIVTAVFGLLLFLLLLPLFRLLTKLGRSGLMAWLFTLMSLFFISFAIEIGQQVTGTGSLELEDIVYGLVGFFAVSAGVGLLYLLYLFIKWIMR